jgi:hypothetical protein
MIAGRVLIGLIGHRFPESDWDALLRMARLADDRPSILRGGGGYESEGVEWLEQNLEALTPVLPRFFNSAELSILFTPELVRLRGEIKKRFNISFQPRDRDDTHPENSIDLDVLTAAGVTLFQIYADIMSVESVKDNPEAPPQVTVRKGSVQFKQKTGARA